MTRMRSGVCGRWLRERLSGALRRLGAGCSLSGGGARQRCGLLIRSGSGETATDRRGARRHNAFDGTATDREPKRGPHTTTESISLVELAGWHTPQNQPCRLPSRAAQFPRNGATKRQPNHHSKRRGGVRPPNHRRWHNGILVAPLNSPSIPAAARYPLRGLCLSAESSIIVTGPSLSIDTTICA